MTTLDKLLELACSQHDDTLLVGDLTAGEVASCLVRLRDQPDWDEADDRLRFLRQTLISLGHDGWKIQIEWPLESCFSPTVCIGKYFAMGDNLPEAIINCVRIILNEIYPHGSDAASNPGLPDPG